jgi:hypothetical protein
VTLDEQGPRKLEALPLKLDYCHTRLAEQSDRGWVRRRFETACARLSTEVGFEGGRLVVTWPDSRPTSDVVRVRAET